MSRLQRSGELALRRLPAVLLDLHEASATGKLQIRRGHVVKAVDLADGDPISATSSNREETLGHFLVSVGAITPAQHHTAIEISNRDQVRIGSVLVGMRALTPDRLIAELTNQTRHKLVLALRWPQGAWRFDPAPEGQIRSDGLRLRMVDVVLSGLRDTAVSSESGVEILRQLGGQAFELTERGLQIEDDLRRVFSARVIEAIVNSGQLVDIEHAASDALVGRRAVEALLSCAAIAPKAIGLGVGAPRTFARASVPQPDRASSPVLVREPAAIVEPADESHSDGLFNLLFAEQAHTRHMGAIPVEVFDADSGAVRGRDVESAARRADETFSARRALLEEYLRVLGADHYGVLLVERSATPAAIAAAISERRSTFGKDEYAKFNLGDDVRKLDELHTIYDRARMTLVDDRRRQEYDRELAGGELISVPSLSAEMNFRQAEDLISKQQYSAAVPILEAVVREEPGSATYQALLGWTRWCASSMDGRAADLARGPINRALLINPDHAAAHEYRGRITAMLGDDPPQANFYLERAVELDPSRAEALVILERAMIRGGELRNLERLYKRLLYQVSGKDDSTALALWIRLGVLYKRHLDDEEGAQAALVQAQRLGGPNISLPGTAELASAPSSENESLRTATALWSRNLKISAPGIELVTLAQASGEIDVAYLAAATMVALENADQNGSDIYQQYRPREFQLPSEKLGTKHWSLLRHEDDTVEVGDLIELIAPAIYHLAPISLAELDIDPSQLVDENDLPSAFARLRLALIEYLGVAKTPVYVRSELGQQIHVGAAMEPVLLAGDDALSAPQRALLAFRLGRAMTLLWPGRAVGASRPGRVLKAAVLATFRDATGTSVGAQDSGAANADAAIQMLDDERRDAARSAVLRLVAREPKLNLSRWARSLSRTADRVGLLLAGDVPVALGATREVGGDVEDLLKFASSEAHLTLRASLGLGS